MAYIDAEFGGLFATLDALPQPNWPLTSTKPESGFLSQPISPLTSTKPASGFLSQPISPLTSTKPESGFVSQPISRFTGMKHQLGCEAAPAEVPLRPAMRIGCALEDPAWIGVIDEVRVSTVARYTTNFSPVADAWLVDDDTLLLFHLDEGEGHEVRDHSGFADGLTYGPVWIPFGPAPVEPPPDSTEDHVRECIQEGEEFLVKDLTASCCSGLVGVSAEDIPRDDYTQDDYPPGSGPEAGTPPDLFVCIECGDGVCGLAEHFCNCAADCEGGEVGPVP
ncbi:MAG: hypothetical protein Q8P18_24515 [Pseudomonadota bacterium]|nr:hypothetical protein [Pseudomonadota bacterium]